MRARVSSDVALTRIVSALTIASRHASRAKPALQKESPPPLPPPSSARRTTTYIKAPIGPAPTKTRAPSSQGHHAAASTHTRKQHQHHSQATEHVPVEPEEGVRRRRNEAGGRRNGTRCTGKAAAVQSSPGRRKGYPQKRSNTHELSSGLSRSGND